MDNLTNDTFILDKSREMLNYLLEFCEFEKDIQQIEIVSSILQIINKLATKEAENFYKTWLNHLKILSEALKYNQNNLINETKLLKSRSKTGFMEKREFVKQTKEKIKAYSCIESFKSNISELKAHFEKYDVFDLAQ